MRTFLLGICFVMTLHASAQQRCASIDYIAQEERKDPSLSIKLRSAEQSLAQMPLNARATGGAADMIIRIPVVVHVLYRTAAENIPDTQIRSQIAALNRDYRRMNADTVNTPARFKSRAADIDIEFYLATADPNGRATTGIIRKQTGALDWSMDDKIKFSAQGGDNAWDSRYYLNIWVGKLFGILGYSSSPGGAAEKDGVVIGYNAFGTVGVYAPYDMGRTAVHEVGHWLGLKHIWGDAFCGDDSVDDTPKQGNFTSGCPGNAFRSSCDNGTDGDMYMNYMDFTDDACMNLFTQGQKQRMMANFRSGGPRNLIMFSKGLDTPWVEEAPPVVTQQPPAETHAQLAFYPNPATSEITLDLSYNPDWIGRNVSIVNMNGVVLFQVRINAKTQKINLAQLRPGLYFIQGDNGSDKIREKVMKM